MSDAASPDEPLPPPPTRALSSQRYAGLQRPYSPGERGGPGGRSLSVGKALSLARKWSPHAVQLCGKTIVDESAPLSLRLRAAETILAVAVPKATPDRASVLKELLEIVFVDTPGAPVLNARTDTPSQHHHNSTPDATQQPPTTHQQRGEERDASMESRTSVPGVGAGANDDDPDRLFDGLPDLGTEQGTDLDAPQQP